MTRMLTLQQYVFRLRDRVEVRHLQKGYLADSLGMWLAWSAALALVLLCWTLRQCLALRG